MHTLIFVVKLIPRMSVGIIRIRKRQRMLMLPLLSPSIREIIQTGIEKVVRNMMVKLKGYLKVYNRTIM